MKIRIYDAGTRQDPKSGYGLMAKQLLANLESLGNEMSVFPDKEQEGQDVVLWVRPPHYVEYDEFDEKNVNVFYTMHEKESFEGWKSNWPQLLNKCDAVIVPTEWNKKIFKRHGVNKPIYVVPLGVNSNDFHGAKTYRFSIMTLHDALGSDGSRENWKQTLEAYHNAFMGNHNQEVLLTIKSYHVKRKKYYDYLHHLRNSNKVETFPPVELVDLDLTPRDLNNLYSQHWLFIKNANREGWSLPLMEAAACGLDVAHTDLPVFSWLNGYKKRYEFPLNDVGALTQLLRDRFREWKKEKGFIRQYTWRRTAQSVENVLTKVLAQGGENGQKKT